MNPAEYDAMRQVEDTMWWYVGMRQIARTVVGDYLRPGQRILDAGCGTGGTLAWLDHERLSAGTAFGIDYSPDAVRQCAARHLPRVGQASITALPFADATFDGIFSFDVIYHLNVADDVDALREVARVMRPGAWACLRVPAFDWLRSAHDVAVHTRQRYTRTELAAKATAAGLLVERTTYANTVLFAPAVLSRFLRRHESSEVDVGSDVRPAGVIAQAIGRVALTLEAMAVSRVDFPFGLSAMLLATRSETAK